MFNFIRRKLRFRQLQAESQGTASTTQKGQASFTVSGRLEKDLQQLQQILNGSSDVITRRLVVAKTKAVLVFVNGLVDKKVINEDILRPLMAETAQSRLEYLEEHTLHLSESKRTNAFAEVADALMTGQAALIVDGMAEALLLEAKGWEKRSIEPPQTEVVVRGPHEGFIESLATNAAMLRRKISHPGLVFDKLVLGQRTKTSIYVAYVKGLAEQGLIDEVKRRLSDIKTDAILESGYIEEFIEDAPFSPFATIGNTERPDKVAAKLLEGRVAVLVDGTPMVLTMPMLFVENLQSCEDYYSRPYYATLVRWIRFLALGLSLLAPAVYVALTTFHQELLPTSLLLTMAAAREGTPFPAVVETLIMGLAFEIFREAGVRLPRPVGQAVSIVGALVIGEAAVSAGLIGAPLVIVVALTAIASFVVTSLIDATTFLRIIFVLLAGLLGAFGIVMGLLGLLIHLATLRSFGAPYLSPIAPTSKGDFKDVFVRSPLWAMFTRPRTIGWRDPQRQAPLQMPGPPSTDEVVKESIQEGKS